MKFWPFDTKGPANPLQVDFHSHLIPGVDDGVTKASEAIAVLKSFSQLGYKKVITTPHIYPEVYPNKEEDLISRHQLLLKELKNEGVDIQFELAAEYFLHEELLEKVRNKKNLLTFGDNQYLLIETGFHQKPMVWEETIFELQVQGYRPVLAHPERYAYIADDIKLVSYWRDQGIKMQINTASLIGLYGKDVQRTAKELIKQQQVDFLCSDLHREDQLKSLIEVNKSKLFQRAALLVQNNGLL